MDERVSAEGHVCQLSNKGRQAVGSCREDTAPLGGRRMRLPGFFGPVYALPHKLLRAGRHLPPTAGLSALGMKCPFDGTPPATTVEVATDLSHRFPYPAPAFLGTTRNRAGRISVLGNDFK